MFYFDLLEKLFHERIQYLLVGGLSVNLHGIPRVTQDIDLIILNEKENILKVLSVLNDLSYKPTLPIDPENLTDPDKVREWIKEKNMIAFSFHNEKEDYKTVDLVISHNLDFDSAFRKKTVIKAMGIEIYLACIDDMISMKEDSGREQDKSDIEMLRKVKALRGDDNG